MISVMTDYSNELPNKSVNKDEFSSSLALYKCAGSSWH